MRSPTHHLRVVLELSGSSTLISPRRANPPAHGSSLTVTNRPSASTTRSGSRSGGTWKAETVETISFRNQGVACTAFIISSTVEERAAAAKEAATKARARHYAGLLPSPEDQIEMMKSLRWAQRRARKFPDSKEARRDVEREMVRLHQGFAKYLDYVVQKAASQQRLITCRIDAYAELSSFANELFWKTVSDYKEGSAELSRLLGSRLKFELRHEAHRIASRATVAGALSVSDKVLFDSTALRAAEQQNAVEDLAQRRNWSAKRLQTLKERSALLNPVARLDAPPESLESGERCLGEAIRSADSALDHLPSIANSELSQTLGEALTHVLEPIEQLVIGTCFGIEVISVEEVLSCVRHSSGRALTKFKWDIEFSELPELLGHSLDTLRRARADALKKMRAYLADCAFGDDILNAFGEAAI